MLNNPANNPGENLSPSRQQEYEGLIKELRCVTCPNQSILDSQAEVALALKEDILLRMQEGESTHSICQTLQSAYGDYILYRPPLNAKTSLLWWGPFIMLAIGLGIWLKCFGFKKKC